MAAVFADAAVAMGGLDGVVVNVGIGGPALAVRHLVGAVGSRLRRQRALTLPGVQVRHGAPRRGQLDRDHRVGGGHHQAVGSRATTPKAALGGLMRHAAFEVSGSDGASG